MTVPSDPSDELHGLRDPNNGFSQFRPVVKVFAAGGEPPILVETEQR